MLLDTSRDAQGNPLTQAEMDAAHKASAKHRVENFPVDVTASRATPPSHMKVWHGQVRQTLTEMSPTLGDPKRFLPPAATELSPGYEDVGSVSGLKTGVLLSPAGRERVARHYARKYEAHIEFQYESSKRAADLLPELFESWRSITPGQDVRRAHCFNRARKDGRDEAHASVVIYIREGDREALMLCDSTHKDGDTELAAALAKGCAKQAAPGNPIAVYQHVWCVQHDQQSCWVFALKAAAALTGQLRHERAGQHADTPTVNFIRPNLLHALDERRVGPAPAGVIAVWSLPELARMGQSLDTVAAHAGPEIDQELAGKSRTLRDDLEKYSYATPEGYVIPNYMRQKGERMAELADILEWSERISAHVGPENWNDEREGEFVSRMTKLVRGGHYVPTTDDLLEELSEFLAKPQNSLITEEEHREQFVKLAQAAYREVIGTAGEEGDESDEDEPGALPGLPRATRELIPQLSAEGLDQIHRHLATTVDRLLSFAEAARAGARKFNRDATLRQWADGARSLASRQENILTSVECEKEYRLFLSAKGNGDKASVAEAIAALSVGDIDAFKEAAMLVIASIDGLAPISPGADEQDEYVGGGDLFLREQLLVRLKGRCEQQQARLQLQEVDSDDEDDEDDDSEAARVAKSNAAAMVWLNRVINEIDNRVMALSTSASPAYLR